MRPMLARLGGVIALVGLLAGCAPAPTDDSGFADPVPLPERFQRGMNIEPIGDYGGTLELDALPANLDTLAALGVDHVALIPSFFQPRLGQVEFVWPGSRERVAADTRAAIRMAHARGLRVLLKPHLWLQDRSDGAWRGDILPTDERWPAWRTSYRGAVLEYANMAAEEGVAAISIGSELTELALARPEFWRRLTADVRDVYPGTITYAANWDREFAAIAWWDAVDMIGVDAFWPLQTSADETLTASLCRNRLGAIRDSIAELSQRVDRPVLLTEIGYKSAAGGAWRPWEWHDRQRVDVGLQSLLYRCVAEVLGPSAGPPDGWLHGVYFWVWYVDRRWGGLRNSDFTPRGKPAQDVLESWFDAR